MHNRSCQNGRHAPPRWPATLFATLAMCLCYAAPAIGAHGDTSSADAKPERRPNILFAFADDWGRYASAYAKLEPGGPSDVIHTPHFDRVAREGVLFTNAFVNAPSCTPCRSSILSGQYFWRTGLGAILQGAIWDESIPSYPLILRDSGYHIGHTYKVWSPGTPRDAPYGGRDYAYVRRGRHLNQFSQYISAKPDRLPMGTGPGLDGPDEPLPTYEQLRENTFAAFGDMDASPTKAWIFTHRNDPGMDRYFDFAFGRRPAEELYDPEGQEVASTIRRPNTHPATSRRLYRRTAPPIMVADPACDDSTVESSFSGG